MTVPKPPFAGDQRTTLVGFLDYSRAVDEAESLDQVSATHDFLIRESIDGEVGGFREVD